MRKLTIIMATVALSLSAGVAFADIGPGAQMQEYSLFEQIDQNGDEIIIESEFQSYSMKQQDKTELFAVIDKNGDGVISMTEWQSYQESRTTQPMATEEPVKEKKRPGGDVWDDQVYDVNDPRKIEPTDKSMKE